LTTYKAGTKPTVIIEQSLFAVERCHGHCLAFGPFWILVYFWLNWCGILCIIFCS